MTFHILTIFPKLFEPYLAESVIGRGVKAKKIKVKIHDLREYTLDKHNKVDDIPYGGGPGMVLSIEPLARAMDKILSRKAKSATLVVLTSAGGHQFNSQTAARWAKEYKHVVIIAGRYEGYDERIKDILRDRGVDLVEASIGPYVLTGGELPALVMIDAVSRHIKGVLGKHESLEEERYGVGVPAYTRPESFRYKGKEYKVPKVLLSGNHSEIENWRKAKVKK